MWYLLLCFIAVVALLIGAYNYSSLKSFDLNNFDFDGYLESQEVIRACALVISFCLLGILLLIGMELSQ